MGKRLRSNLEPGSPREAVRRAQWTALGLSDEDMRKPRIAEVIRPLARPCSDKPAITVLHGSLAPDSAIVKLGVRAPGRKTIFTGPAVVYENCTDAMQGIEDGSVRPGDALIVRGMGPKGGPGMAGPASMVVFALAAAGLENEVVFITDGQLSGLCNKGLTVAEVSPEAAVGGPLGLVERGDRIVVDVDRHLLALDVPEMELEQRRTRRGPVKLPPATGYLSIYQRCVQSMSSGAVLVERANPEK